jgi:lipopolysaccharide export system permease protein
MRLIERYVFRRMLGAFLLSLGGLAGTVWLSQALRELDLITSKGQNFITFFRVSGLIFPGLLLIVTPVAILIASIYTLNQLNADSELVVINASGASQARLLKPAFSLGLIGAIMMGAMSLYLVPQSLQSFRGLLTGINADLITNLIHEGSFMQLSKGLVFHVRDRHPDGTLEGIFIQDERQADQSSVYIANRGVVLRNPLGTFLIMQNGTIQQRSATDNSMSIIEFQSYAFDLSTFGSHGALPTLRAQERDTAYLMAPDPNDTEFQKRPGSFAAELADRLSMPLYAFLFALLPVAALGQAQTTRQGRGLVMLGTILVGTGVRTGGFMLASLTQANVALAPTLYLWPLAFIALALIAVYGSFRFGASNGIAYALTDFGQNVLERLGLRSLTATARRG